MSKTAFIFPGQGAQYVGMGKDFYEHFPIARKVYEEASKASDVDVTAICFEENEQIHCTEYTQIAMLTTEIAMLRVMEEKGYHADVAAGLSLGEYAALAVSGAIDEKDLFYIVRKRGRYMQEAVPNGGAMMAVLGLTTEVVEETVAITAKDLGKKVSVANYNCPGQIVITGEDVAVEEAGKHLLEAGAKRCISLKVSGPFHSEMLLEAGQKLRAELNRVQIKQIKTPYLTNVTANYVENEEMIKDLLTRQISSSVKWQQTIEKMIADGIDTFIEIGPGKTLSGFIRKINKDVRVINIEKVEDLQKLEEL